MLCIHIFSDLSTYGDQQKYRQFHGKWRILLVATCQRAKELQMVDDLP